MTPEKMECHGFYAWQGNWSRLFGAAFPETAPAKGIAPLLTRVPVVWFSFDEQGRLVTTGPYAHRPRDWGRVVTECRRRGLAVDMTVAHLDGPALESILTYEKVRDRIVRGIVREVAPFDGVNIDLEGLAPKANTEKPPAKASGSYSTTSCMNWPPPWRRMIKSCMSACTRSTAGIWAMITVKSAAWRTG